MEQHSLKTNTIFNIIKTLTSILFPLITFPYISRVLLPDNVGKINFGSSIVAYFSLMASLGISTHAIRECSAVREDKEKLSSVASQIFSINLVTTIIAYFTLAIALVLFPKLKDYRLLIIIQSLSIVATTFGADWLNTAMEDFKYITIRTVLCQLFSLILMLSFVHKPEDYMKYAVICLISSAGSNIFNIFYRRRYCTIRLIWRIRTEIEWKRHLRPIFLLFVMILAQSLFNNVDVTMLGIIKGDKEVGFYSTAHKVANIIAQVIVSSAWVVMPRISHYFTDNDYERINGLLSKIFGFFALIGLPCIIGTVCVSKELIQIIAGSEYAPSSIALRILMIGYIFDLFGNSFLGNIVCLPLKQEKKYMYIWLTTSVLNIILNFFLIPMYGAAAAAFTTALSYCISLILLIVTNDRRIRINKLYKALLSPIYGCIMIVVVCCLLNFIPNVAIKFALKILISVLVYIAVQFIMKNQLFIEIVGDFKSVKRRFHL